MAKEKARLVMTGSGYGAFAERGKWSGHLEFVNSSESLQNWKKFFETGVLHKPSVNEAPDEFLMNHGNLKFLVDTLETFNRNNWYACYQAGIGYLAEEDYEHAEQWLCKSWEQEKNPWAWHGMGWDGMQCSDQWKKNGSCQVDAAGDGNETGERLLPERGNEGYIYMNCWKNMVGLLWMTSGKGKTPSPGCGANCMRVYMAARLRFRTGMILKHHREGGRK